MSRPVLFWVQHLLGIGHQRRAAAIARACAGAGLDVTYVSGGMPIADLDLSGCRFQQLPPLRSTDETFSGLLDEAGNPAGEALMQRRAAMLSEIVDDLDPGVLVTETYPFGRRPFRHELDPVIRRVSARGHCVASVRDILVKKPDPEKYRRAAELANSHFSAVLVHEPEGLNGFHSTFPFAKEIAPLIRQTGYAAEVTASGEVREGGDGYGEVLVSGGGSAVGLSLYRQALAARALSGQAAHLTWRLLVPPVIPDDIFAALQEKAGDGIIIERTRPDFTALLSRAALSVSMAGYNTVAEAQQAGVRMLLKPFANTTETEQDDRARALEAAGRAVRIDAADDDPASLAAAVDRALELPEPVVDSADFRGAERSARIIGDLAG